MLEEIIECTGVIDSLPRVIMKTVSSLLKLLNLVGLPDIGQFNSYPLPLLNQQQDGALISLHTHPKDETPARNLCLDTCNSCVGKWKGGGG